MSDKIPTIAEPREDDLSNMPVQPVNFGGNQLQVGSSDMGFLMTAQQIMVPRKSPGQIRALLANLCAQNGDQYIYSWEVKDRSTGRKVTIEGLTVKAGMDLARIYGNCFAGLTGVRDMGTHWLFQAAFIDLETGFNVRRDFLQRKSQSTGMRDNEREADIIFQIGQSKAIRNVILQANPSDAEFILQESRKRLVNWINANREKADDFIDKTLEAHDIALSRVEAVVGRSRKNWTARDIARVVVELRGVSDGMTNAEDVYPSHSDAARATEERNAERQASTPKPQKATEERNAEPKTPTVARSVNREDKRLRVRIATIDKFGRRTQNALHAAKVEYVGSLVQMTERELSQIGGFGVKCLNEVKAYLASVGLGLGMELIDGQTGEVRRESPRQEPPASVEEDTPVETSLEPDEYLPEPEEDDGGKQSSGSEEEFFDDDEFDFED